MEKSFVFASVRDANAGCFSIFRLGTELAAHSRSCDSCEVPIVVVITVCHFGSKYPFLQLPLDGKLMLFAVMVCNIC